MLVIRNTVWCVYFVCIYMSCRWLSWLIDKFFHKKNLLQIKQQVSKKNCRQVNGDFFMAGICKNAYGSQAFRDKSTCRAVKYNACMLIGDGFCKQSVTSEQVELNDDGGRSVLTPRARTRSKCTQKNNMTSAGTVVKRYSKDDNGCCHDDPSHLNEQRDINYWWDKWRKGHYVNSKKGFKLNYQCITCKKNVTEGFIWGGLYVLPVWVL